MTGDGTAFTAARLRWIAAAIVVLNGFFPAVWILLTSLKPQLELVRKPITYLPHDFTLQNYVQVFREQPLATYLMNSVIVAGVSTVLTLIVSACAAYAIARLRLKYRDLILSAIIASSTFPLVTLLVPIFETMRALGLLNTYPALILPYVVLSMPVTINPDAPAGPIQLGGTVRYQACNDRVCFQPQRVPPPAGDG